MDSEALLIVAHGDCGGFGGNMLVQELARRMRQSQRYGEVVVGFMRSDPSIEAATSQVKCDRLRIYPLFMSDGYYVREAIPRRLGIAGGVDSLGRRVSIDEPLGLHPRLPELLISAVIGTALGKGIQPQSACLLLVAHGSQQSPHSAAAAREIRDRIDLSGTFQSVEVSFLEEEPLFIDALENRKLPTFVLGLFAGEGMHATGDIQGAVTALGNPNVHLVEQLGGYARVIELIAAGLK